MAGAPDTPELVLIAAVARNGVIGRGNRLPWHLPEDLRHFKAVTMGHPILMGRRTWESLGRPLPGRRNLVVSRNRDYRAAGAEVFPDLAAALVACAGEPTVFVIGGGELYAQALPAASRLLLTEVGIDPDGDAYFPAFARGEWNETTREPGRAANGLSFAFVEYRRRPAATSGAAAQRQGDG
jgi:dihydrofolate reductase